MSFWSTEKFAQHVEVDRIVVPYERKNLRHGAYELAVGPEAFITSREVKETLEEHQQMIIPSGQFGLLITEEVVSIPTSTIGFISIRASIKFQGLVNVSGFHVDPGFSGRLKFSVYNAGSRDIVIERGQRIFMLWLSDLDRPTSNGYEGPREGQMGISAEDVGRLRGDIASPAALKKEIQDLKTEVEKKSASFEKDISTLRALIIPLLVGVLLLGLRECVSPSSLSIGPGTSSAPGDTRKPAKPQDSTLPGRPNPATPPKSSQPPARNP